MLALLDEWEEQGESRLLLQAKVVLLAQENNRFDTEKMRKSAAEAKAAAGKRERRQ